MQVKLRHDGQFHTLNPYALIWEREHYYLVCNNENYDNISFYRLERMKNLVITEQKIKEAKEILGDNADLKIDEIIKTSLYNFNGAKIKLELEVAPIMVDDLIDYFGPDIYLLKNGEMLRAFIDVMEGEGLYYWLMQYGHKVKVISPANVRDKLLENLNKIYELYAADSGGNL